jgi:hypothetical protein
MAGAAWAMSGGIVDSRHMGSGRASSRVCMVNNVAVWLGGGIVSM